MRKLFLMTLIIPLISLWVFPLSVFATTIVNGDLVRVQGGIDVYIIKIIPSNSSGQVGEQYKRLILNPEIFNQYGHLKWSNIKTISQTEMDRYITSDLVRAVGDERVYKLYPNGDIGEKRWIKTAEDFNGFGYRVNAIYEINNFERDYYTTGADLVFNSNNPANPIIPITRTTPITINVPNDYSTIQAAINASINGDTISIESGTYNENIVIDKNISLVGNYAAGIVIDGKGVDNAITIKGGQNILIQRFTIKINMGFIVNQVALQ